MFHTAANQSHIRAGLCQSACDTTGDARAAAGYERDVAFENVVEKDAGHKRTSLIRRSAHTDVGQSDLKHEASSAIEPTLERVRLSRLMHKHLTFVNELWPFGSVPVYARFCACPQIHSAIS
jgi:hypothetical protein